MLVEDGCTSPECFACLPSQSLEPSRGPFAGGIVGIEAVVVTGNRRFAEMLAEVLAVAGYLGRMGSFAEQHCFEPPGFG